MNCSVGLSDRLFPCESVIASLCNDEYCIDIDGAGLRGGCVVAVGGDGDYARIASREIDREQVAELLDPSIDV